eukprot:1550590-Pleurochrysis_carterae.AAC.1
MGRRAIRKLLARVTLLARVQILGGTRPCRACVRLPNRVTHLIATPLTTVAKMRRLDHWKKTLGT